MTTVEYDKLAKEQPDLQLPPSWCVHHSFLQQIALMTPAGLAQARRAAIARRKLLGEPLQDYDSRRDAFGYVIAPEVIHQQQQP